MCYISTGLCVDQIAHCVRVQMLNSGVLRTVKILRKGLLRCFFLARKSTVIVIGSRALDFVLEDGVRPRVGGEGEGDEKAEG